MTLFISLLLLISIAPLILWSDRHGRHGDGGALPPFPRRGNSRPRVPPRVKITAAALRWLVAQVRRHAEAHPNTEMGCLLVGIWRNGVPWILGAIDQGPRAQFSAASVKFDAEYQAALYRLSRAFHSKVEPLGVAHLQPGDHIEPSQGDWKSDREWLRQATSPRAALFIILTLRKGGERTDFEERAGRGAVRYLGVQLNAYWLNRDDTAYRLLRIETACGPDHGGDICAYLPVVRGRYIDLAAMWKAFPGARIIPIQLVDGPALGVSIGLGDLRGLALFCPAKTRWLGLFPSGEWKAYELTREADPVAAGLEMLAALRRVAVGERDRSVAAQPVEQSRTPERTEWNENGREVVSLAHAGNRSSRKEAT